MTRGKLIASHIKVSCEGVWDQPEPLCRAGARGLLVGVGEETLTAERSGSDALRVDTAALVARLVADSGVGVPGKSRGWPLVATIVLACSIVMRDGRGTVTCKTK